MTPYLTVIVPTLGRPTLRRTLESLAAQRMAQYLEVIVVQDTHGRAFLPLDISLGTKHFSSIVYAEHDAGLNAWGHPQRNYGMKLAQGQWVCSLDDDDAWVPAAFDLIATSLSEDAAGLHIFRMHYPETGATLWGSKVPSHGNVGTPMMVWRSDQEVGQWGNRYEGDYDFLKSTMFKLPGGLDDLHWHEHVIANIRPPGLFG